MQENILPIEFKGDYIRLLDQTSLPTETKFLKFVPWSKCTIRLRS